MVNRDHILAEIRRTAAENGGKPLGSQGFATATGIRASDWSGRFWARWSDALREAGFEPNTWTKAFEDDLLITHLIAEIRRLGRFPTTRELQMRRAQGGGIPSQAVFRRLGSKRVLAARVATYCEGHAGYEDVPPLVAQLLAGGDVTNLDSAKRPTAPVGYVYLLKARRYYKIGRTNAAGRRERELAIQLPERTARVHVIKTDDPVGIEKYWHLRFADRRVRTDAEWFDLTKEDIAAFKRRKFM